MSRRKPSQKRPPQICKCCGLSLAGVSPIKPFSEVYLRMCPARDGDPCERASRR